MPIRVDDFRVPPAKRVKLKHWPTRVPPHYASKDAYEARIAAHISRLSKEQDLFYASNKHALLLIFQAMDAGGKDSVIKHVMSGVNPQGCRVVSFKHPTTEELEHDFLWRTTRELPPRGMIGIFNRSYYEEVLIARVHPEILRAENLPQKRRRDDIWEDRYRSILGLEEHLSRNGTKIVKLFLHLSKHEQKLRFLRRIEDPDKNWKLSADDMNERRYWRDYMRAYEACLGATSTKRAPWYVVPADDKPNARLIVSEILVETFRSLKLTYPPMKADLRRRLASLRKGL